MRQWMAGAACALIAGIGGAALAQQPQPAQQNLQGMAACRTEIQTYCRGLEAGGGQRIACLEKNLANLSPACAASVQQRMDARAERQAARSADPKGMPPTPSAPPPAGQPPAAAMSPPTATPSAPPLAVGPPAAPSARTAPPIAAPRTNPLRDCREDMRALCAAAQPGRGARVACLRQSTDRLTPACAQALAAFDGQRQLVKSANRQACQADARRLCRGQRGPDRLACLQQNIAQLSPACVEQTSKRAARLNPPSPAIPTPR